MDYLWTPWRFHYVSHAEPADECIFCAKAADRNDAQNYVLHRGARNFVLLNLYPYTTGHLMIAPYAHIALLEEAEQETLHEMIELARTAECRLRDVYHPHGFNVGMNLGECAGAGVAGHIHLHVLPRWSGDSSFMTTVGETRILPEDLGTTYRKLAGAFQ
jgi:ATP adenylyltransferase